MTADWQTVGKDPSFPLPTIPEAHVDADPALERAEFWAGKGGGSNARVYEKDALTAGDANQDFLSFTAAGDLAAMGLADHLHLQKVLGFSGVKDVTAGLSDKQKDQVSDDLDVAETKIDTAENFLTNALDHVSASQTTFIGAARLYAAYLSGNAGGEIDKRIATEEGKRDAIQAKIKNAAEIGKKVQSVIKLAMDLTTFGSGSALSAAKTAMGAGDLATGSNGMLGSLVEAFASSHYNKQLAEIDNQLRGLGGLQQGAKDAQSAQLLEGHLNTLKGAFSTLRANVNTAALHAQELRNIMRTPPKKQGKQQKGKERQSAEEVAAAADAKDPVKRVEIFVTSAMATGHLLDSGIHAGKPIYDNAQKRQMSMINDRPKHLPMEDSRWGMQAEPVQRDFYQVNDMVAFVSAWVTEAEKQRKSVGAVADQVKTLQQAA